MENGCVKRASARFNVPLGTLSTYILETNLKNVGNSLALTIEQEQDLVNLIMTL